MAGLGQAFGGLWVDRVLSLMPDWAPGSLLGRVVVNQRNKPRAHLQRTAERARRDDEWGLEALEEASRKGEG